MVVASAKVSTTGEEALKFAASEASEGNFGLINYLMKNKHGTPFESGSMSFFVHAPQFVWWEWVRHRVGWSYNLESSRYHELEPLFWIPRKSRRLVPGPEHKPAHPQFVMGSEEQYLRLIIDMKFSALQGYAAYCRAIQNGIALEVARTVLSSNVYFSGWVTCNPRSLMNFLSLRREEKKAMFISHPQQEIEEPAISMEAFFAKQWPLTYKSYVKNGRVAP